LNWKFSRVFAFEDARNIGACATVDVGVVGTITNQCALRGSWGPCAYHAKTTIRQRLNDLFSMPVCERAGLNTVAVLHVTDDALAGAALVERMKLSCEDARGLVIERHPGAAAAVDQQSGSDPSGRRARLPRRHRPSGQPVASRRRQRSLLGLAEPGKRARASLNLRCSQSQKF
jgi:hypothetical protein